MYQCHMKVAFKTKKGTFLTAVNGGGIADPPGMANNSIPFHTNATQIGPWEIFALVPQGERYLIQTVNGYSITFVNNGGMGAPPGLSSDKIPLRTDAANIGEWETFTLVLQGDNRYAIQTANGYYLTAIAGGGKGDPPGVAFNTWPLHTDSTHQGPWEMWELIFLDKENLEISTATESNLVPIIEIKMDKSLHPENDLPHSEIIEIGNLSNLDAVGIITDWWQKRPTKIEVYEWESNHKGKLLGVGEFTSYLDNICGTQFNSKCEYPKADKGQLKVPINSPVTTTAIMVEIDGLLSPPNQYVLLMGIRIYGSINKNNLELTKAVEAIRVAFQSNKRTFLTAVNGGGMAEPPTMQPNSIPFHTNATEIGPWEIFTLVPQGKRYSIQTANGYFITFEQDGNVGDPPGFASNSIPLRTDATDIGEWETFTLVPHGGKRYAIQTANGCYLTAVDGGGKAKPAWWPADSLCPLQTHATRVDNWQLCHIIFLDDNNSETVDDEETTAEMMKNLVESGEWYRYYQTLSDFEFIQSQIQQLGIEEAIANYQWLNPIEAAEDWGRNPILEVALKQIKIALQLSPDDPKQLASQLWGRLQAFIYMPTIEALLEQAYRHQPKPWLRPLFPCLEPTGYGLAHLLKHKNTVTSVAISTDGDWIVTGTDAGVVTIWLRETETIIREIAAHTGSVTAVDITPDGQRVVSACGEEMVKVWDVATGLMMFSQPAHKNLNDVSISSDSKQVAYGSVCGDDQKYVWDLTTEEIVHQANQGGIVMGEHTQLVYQTSGSKFGIIDLVTGAETNYDLNDFIEGETTSYLLGNGIIRAAISPDQRWLILDVWYDYSGTTIFLDLENQTGFIHDFNEGDLDVRNAIAITPDSKQVIVLMQEEVTDYVMGPLSLEVFDLETEETIKKCSLPYMFLGSEVYCQAAITPDGRYGVSAVETSIVRVWELSRSRPSQLVPIHTLDYEYIITGLGFTPDEQLVISRSEAGIQAWSLATGAEVLVDEGDYDYEDLVIDITDEDREHQVPIPGTDWIVVSNDDYTPNVLIVRTVENEQPVATFFLDTELIGYIVSPDGRTIVAGDVLGKLYFLRLQVD